MTPKQIERFWKRVYRDDGCWEWTGTQANGIGLVKIDGVKTHAHRIAYELERGPIPEGLDVYHSCDSRGCCNPDHLWVGTIDDAIADAKRRGRRLPKQKRVKKWFPYKLSDTDVADIRAMRANGERLQTIADKYGVHLSTISYIVNYHRRRYTIEQTSQRLRESIKAYYQM